MYLHASSCFLSLGPRVKPKLNLRFLLYLPVFYYWSFLYLRKNVEIQIKYILLHCGDIIIESSALIYSAFILGTK